MCRNRTRESIHSLPSEMCKDILHTGSTPTQLHWDHWLWTITGQHNLHCVLCDAMNCGVHVASYFVSNAYYATQCYAGNCHYVQSVSNAVQCLGLQSLILSKHVMFGQQSASMSPNILNHNWQQNLRFFTLHNVARNWQKYCAKNAASLSEIVQRKKFEHYCAISHFLLKKH